MKNTKIKILLIVCVCFLFGTISLLVSVFSIGNLSETTTTSRNAEVMDVEIIDTDGVPFVRIFTREYDKPLYIIPSVVKRTGVSIFREIESGDIVSFRVENNFFEQYDEKTPFIHIVSLKKETETIFSLSDYNSYFIEDAIPAKRACVGLVIVNLILLAYITGINVKKRKNKTVDGSLS